MSSCAIGRKDKMKNSLRLVSKLCLFSSLFFALIGVLIEPICYLIYDLDTINAYGDNHYYLYERYTATVALLGIALCLFIISMILKIII
jgi:hypothetical protein